MKVCYIFIMTERNKLNKKGNVSFIFHSFGLNLDREKFCFIYELYLNFLKQFTKKMYLLQIN